jgi:aryl-alcohol dehydrogenase-like predicted oxidoreductase
MRTRRLGQSDLHVSEIALGSWLTYGAGVDEARAHACIRAALDAGINLFDTANVYGYGSAEEVLGRALAGVPRDRYLVATKLFFPMPDGSHGLSRAQIHAQLDGSLRRLGTGHIDLYQCHRFDEATPLEETMQALTEVVQAGKVRYIGFSEWPVAEVERALALPGVARFVASQPQYSMIVRTPERRLIPLCRQHGISQLAWSPLLQGVLTGKYRTGAPPDEASRAANAEMGAFLPKVLLSPLLLDKVERLRPLAAAAGMTLAQLALAWVLREPNVAATIVGASRPDQVHENAAAAGRTLAPETFAAVEEVLLGDAAAAASRSG